LTIKYAVEHAGWEVIWARQDKSLVAIDFEHDFVGALELYEKIKKAGKPLATLRCKNIGFAPPEKYENKMEAYNHQGVWWCPYCMKLRRFELRAWAEIDDHLYRIDPERFCPICDISQGDHNICLYNPAARRIRDKPKRLRAGKSSKRGKRRR